MTEFSWDLGLHTEYYYDGWWTGLEQIWIDSEKYAYGIKYDVMLADWQW